MIPSLAKLERLHPDTVVGVPAGDLHALLATQQAMRLTMRQLRIERHQAMSEAGR